MRIDPKLDCVIVVPGKCTGCGADIPEEYPGEYCPKCVAAAAKTAKVRVDPLTRKLAQSQEPPEVVEARKELAARELARRRLLAYIKRFDPSYDIGWFHADLAARLERFSRRVANGESPRLILSVPPRHGKSLQASQYFPAWHLGQHPRHEFIVTSHTLSLALDFSRATRATMSDEEHAIVFPDSLLDPLQKNAAGWKTTSGGGYTPAGVGGAIVGKGAHILVIDDPVKNAEEANSQTVREGVWQWYTTTARTRLAPGGGVLIIMQRWHLDDLAGRSIRLAAENDTNEQWEVVIYPAIAEEDEYRTKSGRIVHAPEPGAVLLRQRGDALHPSRWPVSALMATKAVMSPMEWGALYQQQPITGDNAMFTPPMIKRCKVADIPPRLKYYTANDLAIGQKQQHDWTVSLTGGLDEQGNLWLVDLVRDRLDSYDIVEMVIDSYFTFQQDIIGIEKGHLSMAIGPFLEQRIEERKAFGINIQELPVSNRDKVARARSIQGRMRQGKVFIPEDAPWAKQLIDELLTFPMGQHDDMVDALSWLGLMLDEMLRPEQLRQMKESGGWRDRLKGLNKTKTKSWRAA